MHVVQVAGRLNVERGVRYHPLCGQLGLPVDGEWEAFCADVEERGILLPVWTHRDQVIDGFVRCEAVKALAAHGVTVDVPFVEWDGKGSLVDLLFALNVHRRNMSARATRTCLALKEKAAKAESIAMLGHPGRGRSRVF